MSGEEVAGIILLAAGVVAGFLALTAFLIGRGDRREDPDIDPDAFVAELRKPGPLDAWRPMMPAHGELNGPPWWAAPEETSPAAMAVLPASSSPMDANYTGSAEPGTAAAAAPAPAPAPPPPLPEDAIADLVRIALTEPRAIPFQVWELDEFVDLYEAAQKKRGA